MITVSGKKRTVRETTAPFEYADDKTGELKTDDIRVQYYSLTIKDIKDDQAEIQAKAKKNPDGTYYLSDELAKRIHALPDIAGDDGNPLKITAENLDLIPVNNLRAIQKAIADDIRPKEQPDR